MIHQLNPTIDVKTPLGDCEAMFIIDYGINTNSVWCCRMPGGEVKHFYSDDIRIYDNPMNGKGWDIADSKKLPFAVSKLNTSDMSLKDNLRHTAYWSKIASDVSKGNINTEDHLKYKRDFIDDKGNIVYDYRCGNSDIIRDYMKKIKEAKLNTEAPLICDADTAKERAINFFNSLADIGIRGFDDIRYTLYDREYLKVSLKIPQGCRVEIGDDAINFEIPIK